MTDSVQGTWDLELGMWGVYKFGSLQKVARELAKPNLDIMQKQEDRWDKSGTTASDDDDEGEMEIWDTNVCTSANHSNNQDSSGL